MEAFGAPNANGEGGSRKIHWALHTPDRGIGGWATVASDVYAGYHRYGVAWEPHMTAWYFDGRKIAEVPTPADLTVPMYLIVNVAVGGKWAGPADGEAAHMNIDYIRAYTKARGAVPARWQAISPPDGADTMPRGVISAGVVRPGGK
jgi:beta-glucanase (GH16 family)